MKKFDLGSLDGRWKTYSVAACVAILFYVVLTHLGLIGSYLRTFLGFFKPVIIGAIIAYVVNPLAKLIDRTLFGRLKKPRAGWAVSVFIALLVIALIFALLVGTVAPQLVNNVRNFISNINTYIDNLNRFIENIGLPSTQLQESIAEFMAGDDSFISRIGSYLQRNLPTILKASSNVGSGAMNAAIGFIMAIYLLLDKANIKKFFSGFFRLVMSEQGYARLDAFRLRFNNIFSRYISFTLIDAFIVGLANYAFMLIMRMPDALLVSVIVGVTNLAPTFGPIVGAALGGFVLLLVDPPAALAFLIFTIVLQTIDGYILKPRMFGNVLNVPGVLILVSIVVGGRMFGVLGILLAIPFAAVLVYLYSEVLVPWLEKRREKTPDPA